MIIDKERYIARTVGTPCHGHSKTSSVYRNWFLAKWFGKSLVIHIGNVYLPKHLEGKKIRFKMEVVKE